MRRKSEGIKMLAAVAVAVGLLGGGCSSFDQAWRASAKPGPEGSGLTGRWEGSWTSDQTGHHDSLRCVIVPETNGTYRARFRARYRKVVRWSVGYTLPLHAQQGGDTTQFQGEADLGWLAGGVYRCKGTVVGTNFQAIYESKYDRGRFEMVRPGAEP